MITNDNKQNDIPTCSFICIIECQISQNNHGDKPFLHKYILFKYNTYMIVMIHCICTAKDGQTNECMK